MANLTLESAFQRLSIRPSTICRQCRRSITSSSRRAQTSGTSALFDSLKPPSPQSNRTIPPSRRPPREQVATAPPTATTPAETLNPSSKQTKPSTLHSLPPRQPGTQTNYSEAAARFVRDSTERKDAVAASETQRDLAREFSKTDLERQMPRKFRQGDVYAPHDLSGTEAAKWRQPVRRRNERKKASWDVVDQLGMDPREYYKNFTIMSEYMTDMGRIKHSRDTGLRPKNQRRMAKAIRRAIGIGLMPGVHRHPELLAMEKMKREGQRGGA